MTTRPYFILLIGLLFLFLQIGFVSAETTTPYPSFSRNSRTDQATCNVPTQFSTIQDALDDTSCDEILLFMGTFPETVAVNRDVSIRGLDRNNSKITGAISVVNGANLTLDTLTITETGNVGISITSAFTVLVANNITISFNSQAGIQVLLPNARESKVKMTGSSVHDNGKGMEVGHLEMYDSVVTFNQVRGGILINDGGLISNSEITHNSISGLYPLLDGAGVHYRGQAATGDLVIEDSEISGNIALGAQGNTNADGGGIMVTTGHLHLLRTTVNGNVSGRHGGGIMVTAPVDGGGTITIDDSVISNNISYGHGGGVYAANEVTSNRSNFTGNSARIALGINENGLAYGGGVFVTASGDIRFYDSRVSLNKVFVDFQPPNTVFSGSGGGFYFDENSQGVLDRVTIDGNTADEDGGGIYSEGAFFVLKNLTIANNSAIRNGGGVNAPQGMNLKFSTVVGNSAGLNGGGLYGGGYAQYTIVAENIDSKPTPDNHPDCSGSFISSGFSIISRTDGCTFGQDPSDHVGTIAKPLDAGVKMILNQAAGEHIPTMALLPGSPALDGGYTSCSTVTTEDARSRTRIGQDGNGDGGLDGDFCDIGAYEVQSTAPTNITLKAQPTAANPEKNIGLQLSASLSLMVLTLMTIQWQRERVPER